MRKLRISAFFLAVIILGMNACAQKTCPTYIKNDIQKQELSEERV
jgi:hypothetical protein